LTCASSTPAFSPRASRDSTRPKPIFLRLKSGERSPELLNAIFRAIHSIKGAAGSLGFPEIGRFTHEFENLLDDLRKGDFDPDPDAVDTMLACVDHVRFTSRGPAREAARRGARRSAA